MLTGRHIDDSTPLWQHDSAFIRLPAQFVRLMFLYILWYPAQTTFEILKKRSQQFGIWLHDLAFERFPFLGVWLRVIGQKIVLVLQHPHIESTAMLLVDTLRYGLGVCICLGVIFLYLGFFVGTASLGAGIAKRLKQSISGVS